MSLKKEQLEKVLDPNIETKEKMELEERDIQKEFSIDFSTWITPDATLENERARLIRKVGGSLSMVQPLELLSILQVITDGISASKHKEFEQMKDVKRVLDQNGDEHLACIPDQRTLLTQPERVKQLMVHIIKECQFTIEQINNMEKVAMMMNREEEDNTSINPKEVANA